MATEIAETMDDVTEHSSGAGQPSTDPPARQRKGTKVLICQEKPGKTFTIQQAADLASIKPCGVYAAISYAKTSGKEWASIGGGRFHVKRLTRPAPMRPSDSAEAATPPEAPRKQRNRTLEQTPEHAVTQSPASAAVELSGIEIARLMTAMTRGQEKVAEPDVQAVLDWAQRVRKQHQLLSAVLEGAGALRVAEGGEVETAIGGENGRESEEVQRPNGRRQFRGSNRR